MFGIDMAQIGNQVVEFDKRMKQVESSISTILSIVQMLGLVKLSAANLPEEHKAQLQAALSQIGNSTEA